MLVASNAKTFCIATKAFIEKHVNLYFKLYYFQVLLLQKWAVAKSYVFVVRMNK